MNIQFLQWGMLSFMIGLILSLPLAAVHYQSSPSWTNIFTNPRKLKSAHLDFFTQAFAATFAYVLEFASGTQFPAYVAIPLIFGTICNPLLLLLEATPLPRSGFGAILYKSLRATSPLALLFAWFAIAWMVLPTSLILFLALFTLIGVLLILTYKGRKKE
ncbi:hypothetical protein FE782_07550 [Paenibacillus antri]|uniref:Uncharacterized protein n=1 Tax=Paenibacillus antri TaxID=2582848 RepID=A0A5R9GII9_9BACL|nr:hypothetical protein [Paenibacillus antri]TLS53208.1 hypothetical protein FE782_07550 [Paenibacillus antri]